MDLFTQVDLNFTALKNLTDNLYQELHSIEPLSANCTIIPQVYSSPSTIADNQPIELSHISGFNAQTKIISSYKQFNPVAKSNAKYPFRLPGVLIVEEKHTAKLSSLIKSCNIHKDNIKKAISSSKITAEKKREIIQSVAPNAITLQVYRHILPPLVNTRRISFSWCNKFSVKCFTHKKMCDYLNNSMKHPPKGVTKSEWCYFVGQELHLVQQRKKNELIKIKRPLTPAPMANISFIDNSPSILRHAHLPFIVAGDHLVKIKKLKHFTEKNTKLNKVEYMINRLYAL
ncbi:DNA replication terminus site-binding protein [Pseudoalteromonas distincta]|uniref:DNA replication terminus site-binding protein n=1 Tax=Pseudoalteromonas distincta TaxID=77608 RepID=UPI0011F173A5|nr:DNA replication terminus site-binding protein [Pseudoalteromonas distincta]KAA1160865.1 hypothetical protein EU511_08520 [Pseudoalteromonas distincta]